MGIEWYDMIARRNGGYKGRAVFTTIGQSAEEIFEERLVEMLPRYQSVLDAGSGHGEFTLKMSTHAKKIIGFDNSMELTKIAQNLLSTSPVTNVEFVYATTKTELPFEDEQFDLIYDRRGPTSILNHSRILKSGGMIFGIHSSVDAVKERLSNNGFIDISIEEFHDAVLQFPNWEEIVLFLSDTPGNPDFTKTEHQQVLEQRISELKTEGRIVGDLGIREHKYIWQARKP